MTDRDVGRELMPKPTEDWDLAIDAAHALERAADDPDSILYSFFHAEGEIDGQKKQIAIAAFLDGVEREARRKRLDALCGECGVLDRAGIEAVARTEAIKMLTNRPGAAEGFVVGLVDINGLGRVNDQTKSHAIGDELIVGMGESMTKLGREVDAVGRFGGDELVWLMPVQDSQAATKMMENGYQDTKTGKFRVPLIKAIRSRAEKLRHLLAGKYEKYPKDDPNLRKGAYPGRVSVGWHFFKREDFLARYDEYRQSSLPGKSFIKLLIREADAEMYRMKNGM